MQPYNPNAICPKCGGGVIGTAHQEKVVHYNRTIAPERIYRICRHCGYEWNEAPLDAGMGNPTTGE